MLICECGHYIKQRFLEEVDNIDITCPKCKSRDKFFEDENFDDYGKDISDKQIDTHREIMMKLRKFKKKGR